MSKLRLSWPNRITLVRILLIPPFVIFMLNMNAPQYNHIPRYAALAVFGVMALSDALDGWLARRSHDITKLGTFLDPLADKLLITCSCLLLASGTASVPGLQLPSAVVVIIIGKDLWTTIGFILIYFITGQIRILPQFAGKLSTALQLVMVISILLSPDITPRFPVFPRCVQVLWWSAAALAVITILVYTRNGTRFVNEYEHALKQKNLPKI